MNNIFYYYPKCSTCIKAIKELDNKKIKVEKRHIVEMPPTKEILIKIYEMTKDIKKMFNTSGLVYRNMNLKDKLDNLTLDEKIELLSQNPMLIKRPILIMQDKVIIGYKKEIYE